MLRLFLREWHQQSTTVFVAVKTFCIILWKIGVGGSDAPFVISLIRFHFSGKDLEQSSSGDTIGTYKSDFVIMTYGKRYMIQYFFAINGFGQVGHSKDFITDLSVWFKINIRVFTAGWTKGI